MKKPNKHVVKAVAVATAVGTMLPACQPYLDSLIVQSQDLPARGNHAIEIDFSRAELNYLRFLQKLSDDIVQHPMIAQAFARNPQLFLEKYGFHEPIDLDDGMLKLVLALGDQDINRAIVAGDIGLVLKLMEEKGILNDLANSNMFNLNISEEQARELMLAMGFDENEIKYFAVCTVVGVCAFKVLLVGVYGIMFFAGVHFAAVATAAAVAGGIVGVYVGLIYEIEVTWGGSANSGSKLLDNNLPLKIWSLKGKPNDTYIAVNLCVEKEIDKLIDLINAHNLSFDEKKMREFLKFNILMQSN